MHRDLELLVDRARKNKRTERSREMKQSLELKASNGGERRLGIVGGVMSGRIVDFRFRKLPCFSKTRRGIIAFYSDYRFFFVNSVRSVGRGST
jgi:hypothetical protein